jgi:anaerobic magnesium-protoporphyrin IX monomethyl ester cyclase
MVATIKTSSLRLSKGKSGARASSRKRRVLLIQPGVDGFWAHDSAYKETLPHIGVAYVAAVLRQAGHVALVIDAIAERLTMRQVVRRVVDFGPDLVGITANTSQILNAATTAKHIRTALPNTVLCIGGYHVTPLPKQTLEEFPIFDVGVFGEGERTILDLVERLDDPDVHGEVPGLVSRRGEEIVVGPDRETIVDLDSLPFPAYDLMPYDRYFGPWTVRKKRMLNLSTARGCPYTCTFCQNVGGLQYRRRSVESVGPELTELVDRYHVQMIAITDETFTLNNKRTAALCEEMLRRNIQKKATWFCETRVDAVNPELLKLMKRAGCQTIYYGVESGNQDSLEASQKKISKEQAQQAIRWTREQGIHTHAGFILGHPNDTVSSIRKTVQFAIEVDPDICAFTIMIPYPGTEIRRMAEEGRGGYRLTGKGWENYAKTGVALELDGVPSATLERLRLEAFMRFYLRPSKVGRLPLVGRLGVVPRMIAGAMYRQARQLIVPVAAR